MTTDTAMVERVARALAGQDIEIDSSIGQTYAELANTAIVAVLECLRAPTPEMVEAMEKTALVTPYHDEMRAAFTAAIDRALSPSKGEGE